LDLTDAVHIVLRHAIDHAFRLFLSISHERYRWYVNHVNVRIPSF